jgi:hypothetical protein
MRFTYCIVVLMAVVGCGQNSTRDSGRAALDCSQRDRQVCLALAAIREGLVAPAVPGGSKLSRASLVGLDADAIARGMDEGRRDANVRH